MGEAIRPGRRSRSLGPRYAPPPRRQLPAWLVPVVAVAGVIALVLVANLKEPPPGRTLEEPPPEVVGQWTTTDVRYADRRLLISPREVVLDPGEDGPNMHGDILVVTIRQVEQTPVVYIEYDIGEGPAALEIIVDGNDRMHLRNQKDVIWTRTR